MMIVTVTGNLGADAEMRVTPGGDSVCEFRVASTAREKGEDSTTWVRCSFWGKRGESVSKYLSKGTPVTVVGSLRLREYVSQGVTKTSVDVHVDQLALQGGKRDAAQSGAKPQAQQTMPRGGGRTDDDYRSEHDDIPF